MSALKHELYRFFHDRVLLGSLLAVLPFNILIALVAGRGVNVPREYAVYITAANPSAAMWFGVIFAPLYIGMDLHNRTLNTSVLAGNSRVLVMLVKTLFYFALGAVALQLADFITVCIVYGTFPELNCGYAYVTSLSMLLDSATIAIPFILSLVFGDLFAGMAASAVFTYAMQRMMESGWSVMKYYPAYLQANTSLLMNHDGLAQAVAVCAAYIMVCLLIACLGIKRRELK